MQWDIHDVESATAFFYHTVVTDLQLQSDMLISTDTLNSCPLLAPIRCCVEMQWDIHDVESATVFLYRTIVTDPQLHTGAKKRLALNHLSGLWAIAHPSEK